MAKYARYRSSEIKAGIWIIIAGVIFTAFVVAITGSRFWEELDYYRVRLNYVGGLEVGSPVRMSGMLVGKISGVRLLDHEESLLELTLEVEKGLPIKYNTVAFLSSISITSEQHLEMEVNPEPAPLLKPGDLIKSKELTTMDEVMEHVGDVGDTLKVVLGRVNRLLNPTNLARVDSIVMGVNNLLKEASPELKTTLARTRRAVESLDTLLHNVNALVAEGDTRILSVLDEAGETMRQARVVLAGVDTTLMNVDRLMLGNSGDLQQLLDNLSETSRNLKQLSGTIKDNPFLLIRAFPKEERKLAP
ncbi:MAG: MCE family protein [Candidatus Glassbacteria bacterium]|nr:MCE family protein [Candidatus Glassbacteria bacterium]